MADAAKKMMGMGVMGKLLGLDDKEDKKLKAPPRVKPRPVSTMVS